MSLRDLWGASRRNAPTAVIATPYRLATGTGLSLVLLGGCAEEPSVYLRWRITDDSTLVYGVDADQVPPLDSSKDCSDVGIQRVRVNVFSEDVSFKTDPLLAAANSYVTLRPPPKAIDYWPLAIDSSTFSCFPKAFADKDSSVAGPGLSPGTYFAHVMALRRDGSPWPCDAARLNLDETLGSNAHDPLQCASGYEKTGQTTRIFSSEVRVENDNGDPLDAEGNVTTDSSEYTYKTVSREEYYANCHRICEPTYQLDEDGTCVVCPGHTVTETFSIAAEKSHPLDDVVLLAPFPCTDGIDNDGDGRVDHADPACQYDPYQDEDRDSGNTSFVLGVEFLGSSQATCALMGVDRLALLIDDDQELATVDCTAKIPIFGHAVVPGEHTLTALALDSDDQPLTKATFVGNFRVDEHEAGYVERHVQFSDTDFLSDIVSPVSFTFRTVPYPEADISNAWACDPPVAAGGSLGSIEALNIQVRDVSGVALDAATLNLPKSLNADEGITLTECPTTILTSPELLWGAYTVEIQAMIGGETCFKNSEPYPLAPYSAFTVHLDRVLDDDGIPPVGCRECTPVLNDDGVDTSDECGPTYTCINRICKALG